MPQTIGTQLGPYRIVARLGAGGMGQVYRAHDERLGRDIALKVLPPETMADENARARLIREARTASSLNHPHIAHVYEVGEDSDHLYIAMEMVEGQPLSQLIQSKRLEPTAVLGIALQIADALAYAHHRGVIHRDLKSANVMVTPEGWVKVLDFGLAKRTVVRGAFQAQTESDTRIDTDLTSSGLVLGTPNSLPPEVLLGAQADTRSDVWAFGVLLYEMSAGRLPFFGASVGQLAEAIVNTAPAPISARVPVGIRGVIERCLAKEPDARFPDAAAVQEALQKLNPSRRRKPVWVGITALLLATAVGIAIGVWKIPQLGSGGEAGGTAIRSLAVLPLDNLSGDPNQEYFANGMTEELITDLASIPSLKVISRTSAMQYKNTQKTIRQIASELGVDGIVEGSVLRAGERVRITAQLIEAKSDRHLWARSYERDFSDVLALQSEVARDIAQEIRMKVDVSRTRMAARSRRVNPEAYDLYLRGRHEWSKVSPEGIRQATEFFERARALDPSDPRYASGLADAHMLLVQVLGAEPPREGMRRVKEYARMALDADETSAEAHASMGAALFFGDWNWTEAERHLRRSIELNPGYSTGHALYSTLLAAAGRLEEAIEQDRIALSLDPLSLIVNWNAVRALYMAGRHQEALAQSRRTAQLFPESPLAQGTLFHAYEELENYTAAIDLIERHLPQVEGGKKAAAEIRSAYEKGGEPAYWRSMLQYVLRTSKPGPPPTERLAWIHTELGEYEKAIDYLEQSANTGLADALFINAEPHYVPLRRNPRFQALVRRVGLTPAG